MRQGDRGRIGANAILASEIAAKAAPDGYTLLMVASGPIVINPVLYRKRLLCDAIERELAQPAGKLTHRNSADRAGWHETGDQASQRIRHERQTPSRIDS